ncbi:MAG: universal stress protein [Desulfobacteraceae bacterium]|jgi:nucleotide-binding universal stress UspA family protein|nr:universal stress protein [Desulfobacteraceae bacterium]
MVAKILIAFDGSTQSQRAFDFGLDMAVKYGAAVNVLSIARPPEPPVNVEVQAVLEHATEYFEHHFAKMKTRTEAAKIQAVFEVRLGHPAEQIVHVADQLEVDAIVMGHRGESLLQKWLLGSVAKRVLSYAHCTVVVVR